MVEKIQQVMSALNAGGIRARRGYPVDTYFRPESPVAAVYLESAQGETVTVAAQIFSTKATDCEDQAAVAFGVLSPLATVCMAESCRFDRQMGLFSLRLLLRWEPAEVIVPEPEPEPEPEVVVPYQVRINGEILPCVTAFSASFSRELYQNTSEDGETQILSNAKVWILTLEELIPPETEPEAETAESFTLAVTRGGGTETYSQCRWDSVRRTETLQGVRQVRIAKTWIDRTVS